MKEERQKENVKNYWRSNDMMDNWFNSQKQLMLVILSMTQESYLSNTNPKEKARIMRKAMKVEDGAVNMIKQHMQAQEELMAIILQLFVEVNILKKKLQDAEDAETKSI